MVLLIPSEVPYEIAESLGVESAITRRWPHIQVISPNHGKGNTFGFQNVDQHCLVRISGVVRNVFS